MEATVIVAGNVGNRVDWREVGETSRAVFSLACTPRVRRGGVWKDGPTTWYRVTAWRRLAEHIRDSIDKGDAVAVHGRLTSQQWVDRQGVTREDFEIEALWVAPDLRYGTAKFVRALARPAADSPQFESDTDQSAGEYDQARAESFNDAEAPVDPWGPELAAPTVLVPEDDGRELVGAGA